MRDFVLRPRHSPVRWIAVAALLVAAVAHLPVIGEHLEEAPYMGVLFIVLTAACFVLAAAMISVDSALTYVLAVVTCALAVIGYAATRAVAFPMLGDDVGNWLEPLGVVSVVSEAVAVLASAYALRTRMVRNPVLALV